MDHKDLEYFRKLLTGMLEEAQQKGDSTLEELTDSNEVFADPADRATAGLYPAHSRPGAPPDPQNPGRHHPH